MIVLGRLLAIFGIAACTSSPVATEQIRFGDTGSIHGGSTWTITPDDKVRYSAYQIRGGYSTRKDWVWDNSDAKQGHLERTVPGAYQKATAIVRAGLGRLGPQPPYRSNCRDVGSFVIEVTVPGFAYSAIADNCIVRGTEAPEAVREHYAALRAVEKTLMTELGLASW